MNALLSLRRGYGALLGLCGLVAGFVTFAVMLLVVANALMRFGFNAPIAGTLELTEAALPLLIFLSMALTQYEGGHIKVVLLTQRLGPGARRALTVLAMLLGAALFAWAAYAGWNMVARSFAINELERGSIRFPIWPVKFVVFLGLAMLSVQFLLDALTAAFGAPLPQAHAEEVE